MQKVSFRRNVFAYLVGALIMVPGVFILVYSHQQGWFYGMTPLDTFLAVGFSVAMFMWYMIGVTAAAEWCIEQVQKRGW